MNYIIDTEFYENGNTNPILPISIGIVALENDKEFYAENCDINFSTLSPWLRDNVVPHLTRKGPLFMRADSIGPAIMKYLDGDPQPRFWAYFADYDWVVFCQLFGSMIQLPKGFPMFCRDMKQELKRMGIEKPVYGNKEPYHNALADARKAKEMLQHLISNGMKLF